MRKFLAILTLSLAVTAFSASDASAQWRRGYYGGFNTYGNVYTPFNTWNTGFSGSAYYGNNFYYNSGYTVPSYGYYTNYSSSYYPTYGYSGSYYPAYNHPTFRNAGYPRYGWRGW